MHIDLHAVELFYRTEQGRIVAGLLRERLALVAPPVGAVVVGLGYAPPFLEPWRVGRRCVSVMPASHAQPWPVAGVLEDSGQICLAEEDSLPFADLSCDTVLLVHGLEGAEHARRMLRECWRVLRDAGRLVVVVPNRRGLWALSDATPFGQGQPYSPGQLARLLQASMFCIERQDFALFVPPTRLRLVLRGARSWERMGRRLAPHLAGVSITEASKDLYAGLPVAPVAARRRVFAVSEG
jgi:SAM-dependent methyltransferase